MKVHCGINMNAESCETCVLAGGCDYESKMTEIFELAKKGKEEQPLKVKLEELLEEARECLVKTKNILEVETPVSMEKEILNFERQITKMDLDSIETKKAAGEYLSMITSFHDHMEKWSLKLVEIDRKINKVIKKIYMQYGLEGLVSFVKLKEEILD